MDAEYAAGLFPFSTVAFNRRDLSGFDMPHVNKYPKPDDPDVNEAPPLLFFIFGNNIAHSLSPTIHNTAFAKFGLPHHYAIHETPCIDESVAKLIRQPNFGGASVTFPHKLQVKTLLDTISAPATALGAVNTICVSEGRLVGENTDWLGILSCMQRYPVSDTGRAIVVGAGGAARAAVYALQASGHKKVVIVNRTRERAENLTDSFPSLQFELYTSLAEVKHPANLVIACVPADDFVEDDIPLHIFAAGAGLVIEMSYRPPVSALMRVAARQPEWQVFGGVDVLKEQAYAQFKLWTGKNAPVDAIEEALTAKTSKKSY